MLGPPTADSEEELKGLTDLHECVSLLPTSTIGWSDESYPNIDGSNHECAYDECASEIDSHYNDYWIKEDSLDSVVTEESFLDDKSFLGDESFLSLDDNKKLEDDAPASHDPSQAPAADKASVEGNAKGPAYSALNPAATPWHPSRK